MTNQARQLARIPEPVREDRLAKVLARIAKDAEQEPARYLEESEVPHGGE